MLFFKGISVMHIQKALQLVDFMCFEHTKHFYSKNHNLNKGQQTLIIISIIFLYTQGLKEYFSMPFIISTTAHFCFGFAKLLQQLLLTRFMAC